MARAKRPKRVRWAHLVEAISAAHEPRDADEAEANFAKLSLRDKVALVREAAETRAAELTRAFPNVIAVRYGFRRTETRKRKRKHIKRIPCVKLLVKRKWSRGTPDRPDKVPKCLFAYWTIRGTRRLCALPTDVEDAREHARTRLQLPRFVRVSSADPPAAFRGVLACSVKRSGDPARYVVSCQHVLSPGRDLDAAFANAEVSLRDGDGTTIARAVPVRGPLGDIARYSLDAQLARVVEGTGIDSALGVANIEGYARHEDDALLAARLYIHTPRGVISADVNAMPGEEMLIPYGSSGEKVRHERLIELQTELPTHGGDSGSPVFTRTNGGVLMGMLIAGPPPNTPETPGSLSHAIPAAHLLDPGRYVGASGETWRLWP